MNSEDLLQIKSKILEARSLLTQKSSSWHIQALAILSKLNRELSKQPVSASTEIVIQQIILNQTNLLKNCTTPEKKRKKSCNKLEICAAADFCVCYL